MEFAIYGVVDLDQADEFYLRNMLTIATACRAAKITLPVEVVEYFKKVGIDILNRVPNFQEAAQAVRDVAEVCLTKGDFQNDSEKDSANVCLDVASIPANVKRLRFTVSA